MTGRGFAARMLVLALLAAGIAAAWYWRGLFDQGHLTETIARNPLAPVAFLLVQIVGSLLFVPRVLLAIVAGGVFGMWWGILWAALGSVAGAVCGFLVARYLDAGLVERIEPARLAALRRQAERGGWRMVAMVRLVPIPHSLTNYAFGLTRIGLGAYAVGSLLGQLPLTVAFVEGGAAGRRMLSGGGNWRHQMLWPSLIGLSALALSLLVPALLKRRQPISPAPGA